MGLITVALLMVCGVLCTSAVDSDGTALGGGVGEAGAPSLLKAHAIFMAAAWLFFAPLGIIVARYWRREWPEKRHTGTAIWFTVHRVLQSGTVICTLIGIICVFAYFGGYDTTGAGNVNLWHAHPIVGLVILGLIIVQPILALCRPARSSHWRPYFKLTHMLLGRATCLLAIFNIFIGLMMYQSNWVTQTWWSAVIGAFVALHVLVEVILSFLIRDQPDCRHAQDEEMKQLIGTGGRPSAARKILVGSYGLVALTILLTLIISCATRGYQYIYTGQGN